MAWIEIPNSDIDVGSYGREDTVFQRLRSNIRDLRVALFPWIFAEQSTTSTSWVALANTDVEVYIPSYAAYTGLSRKVVLGVDYKVSGGTGNLRLAETISATSGTELTGLNSTSYLLVNPEMAIDASWLGTVRIFQLQAKKDTSGTIYAYADKRIAGRVHY